MRVDGTVKARVRHVIDRGGGAQSTRHLDPVLVSEGKSNSRLFQGVTVECPEYSSDKGEMGKRMKEK